MNPAYPIRKPEETIHGKEITTWDLIEENHKVDLEKREYKLLAVSLLRYPIDGVILSDIIKKIHPDYWTDIEETFKINN